MWRPLRAHRSRSIYRSSTRTLSITRACSSPFRSVCRSVCLSHFLRRQVVRARRAGNYAAFFRLLRTGNYLQACAMFKYVGFMRLEGLKVMNRVLCAGKSDTQIPLPELTRMLLFEDDDDAEEFVTHCGLEVRPSQLPSSVSLGHPCLWRSHRFCEASNPEREAPG
jgi:hypothetical protein